MFGNINSRRDANESSRSLGNKFNLKKPNTYDETTYSISSEDDSNESQKPNNKSKDNKSLKIDNRELESVKKENFELKLKNEVLMMINNVSESMLKNSNLLFDFGSRLEKLENEFRNRLIIDNLKDGSIIYYNKQVIDNSKDPDKSFVIPQNSVDSLRDINKDESTIDDSKNKPIGDDSSLNIFVGNNSSTNKSPISDKSAVSMLPKITEKK